MGLGRAGSPDESASACERLRRFINGIERGLGDTLAVVLAQEGPGVGQGEQGEAYQEVAQAGEEDEGGVEPKGGVFLSQLLQSAKRGQAVGSQGGKGQAEGQAGADRLHIDERRMHKCSKCGSYTDMGHTASSYSQPRDSIDGAAETAAAVDEEGGQGDVQH